MNFCQKTLLISLLFSQFVFAEQTGAITILSTPQNCWVKIDSVLVGQTPIVELSIAAGKHNIQVFPPEKGVWNLDQHSFNVIVQSGQNSTINAIFSRPVFINSLPFEAQLFSDSTKFGTTPLYISLENNKGKMFRLEKIGFEPYQFRLESSNSILAHLEKKEGLFENDNESPHLFGIIPKKRLKSKFTLLALSVVSHWSAFYFKNKADNYFDKYSSTGDARAAEQFFDKTKKFDRFSEISLGVSYASLAGLIYMVIWK